MLLRASALFRLYFYQYYRKAGILPFALIIFYCLYSFVFHESRIEKIDVLNNIFLLCGVYVLFIALQSGHDELNSKTLLKFRTFPVYYGEDFIIRSFALGIFVFILYIFSFFILVVIGDLKSSEQLKIGKSVFSYDEIPFEITKSDSVVKVSIKNKVPVNSELYMLSRFIEVDGRVSDITSLYGEQWIDDYSKRQEVLVLSKRKTEIKGVIGEDHYNISSRYEAGPIVLKLDVRKIFIKKLDLSGIFSAFNGLVIVFFQLLTLAMIFTAMGKRMSFDIAVFIVLAVIVVNYIFDMIGTDYFKVLIDRMSKQHLIAKNYTQQWWEPYLIEWAKFILYLKDILIKFSLPDVFSLMQEGIWIDSIFKSAQSIKSLFVQILFSILIIPLSWKRELK